MEIGNLNDSTWRDVVFPLKSSLLSSVLLDVLYVIILGCLILFDIFPSPALVPALWCRSNAPRTEDFTSCRKFCYLLCFNKKLRWELATHLWEELQVHPSHLLSCDRSCDLMCPKQPRFPKALKQLPWAMLRWWGVLDGSCLWTAGNNLKKTIDQRVKLISPKAFAHGAARRWQQVLELQAWIWKVWVWVKS